MKALRKQQAGVALITAVLIVALATILAVSVGFKGYLGQRRTATTFALDQAYEVALGGEAWAADALRRDQTQSKAGAQQTDDFTDIWATPVPPIPVDGGEFEGTIEDMQGRFNLNNLVVLDQASRQFTIDMKSVERFKRLLEALQIEPKWASSIADFIDADSDEVFPDGAEDSKYTGLNPPYRTPNMPITRTSELLAIAGFGQERFRRLEPFVAALPVGTTINLCTAPPIVLDALPSTGQKQFSVDVQSTAKQRELGCFPNMMAFQMTLNETDKKDLGSEVVGQTSSYFGSTIFVTIGTTQFSLYSLLYRNNAMVRPTLRSFGTP